MQKETNHSSIFEISVATAGPIAATNVTIDDASHLAYTSQFGFGFATVPGSESIEKPRAGWTIGETICYSPEWRQQPALPVWRKDRTDSMYTARRDTFVEKDGKADYSQYATAQYATTTTSVELPAQLSPNPIPYSITRHHKSLNTKNHWHGHRKIHRKAWVSHDLRNITPVTFTSSAQTPVVRGSYDAGTSCSSTPTIIESPESGTKSDPYSVKV
ncbi:unnamed protein product [Umbelopsis vinacea]